ncbi:hypothetical protein Tco_1527533, partial [Tanacetum coccineum]
TANISDLEDTDSVHLPKIKQRPEWLKPIPEEDRPKTLNPDWSVPPNDLPEPENNWANALANSYKDPKENKLLWKIGDMRSFITWFCKRIWKKKLSKSDLEGPAYKLKAAQYLDFEFKELVSSLWIESEREYDISAAYGISHCVVSLKTYERCGYAFLKEIVLRKADYKEYKISEADFKNLHPNDFKDLKHVEDLQLGIESYQTKLNLTQPDWDASDFLFKEDYTIVSKPRAVIYKDKND